MQRIWSILTIALSATSTALASNDGNSGSKPQTAQSLRVFEHRPLENSPRDMMKHYLNQRIDEAKAQWKTDYEARKTPQQIAEYQQRLKKRFVDAIGGFPERTPLNARTVETLKRDGYSVEKIIFESQPRHYVTAALFLPDPDRHQPPYPGVLVPCGHSANGKALVVYQKAWALLALNGMAALIFDPIDQGERHQLLDASGKPRLAGCPGHNMVGVGSILLGRNTARYEIFDGMRGIDYLQSRDDVDANRIGCTGNSGGGTQTAQLMALDDRIAVAAPSCYICGLFGRLLQTNGAQDAEQNIFGQLAFGMDHADYCMMRAPRPTLLCTATDDYFNIEDAWASFRHAKRLYGRLGFAERMSLVETGQPHGYSLRLREGAVQWMSRWLLGRDVSISEPPDLKVLSDSEIQCTPEGEVMLLEGARSVYDLNRDYEKELAAAREEAWRTVAREQLLAQVRDIAGIRKLDDLPQLEVEEADMLSRDDHHLELLLLKPEDGIWLPALKFVPEKNESLTPVLYVHENGKDADAGPDGPIERLVRAGHVVLAVDLRGTGETQPADQTYFTPSLFGPDGQDYYMAYLLGRSYVGMRAEDVLVAARWLAQQTPASPNGVQLVAVGHIGVPALHAAAQEQELFESVKLIRPLISWSNVVQLGYSKNRIANTVHGALRTYDLPNLMKSLGMKLSVEQPLDALGQRIPD